jgi:uncharacterized protein (TIGR02594 family)
MFGNLFKPKPKELPWIVEGKKVFGLHEARDKAKLTAWLKSDGQRLGDTEKMPWCGDYVETAIKNSLPEEPFTGAVGKNPYWARNWLKFGHPCTARYGAIIIFSRGNGGHVGFVVGEDDDDYYVLGGNQSNMVNISRISKDRYLGCTWPASYPFEFRQLPRMTANNIPKTTNEF